MKKILLLLLIQITLVMAYTIKEGILIPENEQFIDDPFSESFENEQSNDLIFKETPLPTKSFNVLNYGLKGDGKTDDSAALKRLAKNKKITNWYFPKGYKFLLSAIEIPAHIQAIYGGGTIVSKAYKTSEADAPLGAFVIDKYSHTNLVIDGLKFETENSSNWPKNSVTTRWYGHITIFGGVNLKNMQIRNCSFDTKYFNFNGIKIFGGRKNSGGINEGTKIYNNIFTNTKEFGIEVIEMERKADGSSRSIIGMHIFNNEFFGKYGKALSIVKVRGGKGNTGKKDGTESYVYGNKVTGTSWGFEIGDTSGIYVFDNVIKNVSGAILSCGQGGNIAPGVNFWYNNHFEGKESAYFEFYDGNKDEFYNNYLKGEIKFLNNHGLNRPWAGYLHDNTIVLDKKEKIFPHVIVLQGIKEGKFVNNKIYASNGVVRGFNLYRSSGGKNIIIKHNVFYMKNKKAKLIDVQGKSIIQNENLYIDAKNITIPNGIR